MAAKLKTSSSGDPVTLDHSGCQDRYDVCKQMEEHWHDARIASLNLPLLARTCDGLFEEEGHSGGIGVSFLW